MNAVMTGNSLQHKPSTSSLKSVGSINRKPAAIAAAARKKEQVCL